MEMIQWRCHPLVSYEDVTSRKEVITFELRYIQPSPYNDKQWSVTRWLVRNFKGHCICNFPICAGKIEHGSSLTDLLPPKSDELALLQDSQNLFPRILQDLSTAGVLHEIGGPAQVLGLVEVRR